MSDFDNISLFDDDAGKNKKSKGKVEVVNAEFISGSEISWRDLFSGYDELYSITYSSGMGFICELIELFENVSIIFGCERVMTYEIKEICALQEKTLADLQKWDNKNKSDLMKRLGNGSLEMRVARTQLSHEKIYLLKSKDGKKRVISGSANMSKVAFSGIQKENICCMDGDEGYDWYYERFLEMKEHSSCDITERHLKVTLDSNSIEDLPIAGTVKVEKALILEPCYENSEDVQYVYDIKTLEEKYARFAPKPDKSGKYILSLDVIKTMAKKAYTFAKQNKELKAEFPKLIVDSSRKTVTLNDTTLDLNPSSAEIIADLKLFTEYMKGLEKLHGDVKHIQKRYFEFANWFFASPFMPYLRNEAVRNNIQLLSYPSFGIIMGKSKGGKTALVETLLIMMIGQKPVFKKKDFTTTIMNNLRMESKGSPIIVDDIDNNRFRNYAIDLIKNDTYGIEDEMLNYPAIVITANEDVRAVTQEIMRRAIICRVNAGLKNSEIIKSNIVTATQNKIGTALYREYLRRMFDVMPEIIESLQNEENSEPPDVLKASSKVILSIFKEHYTQELPHYIEEVDTIENYFSEKITGESARKNIQNAWKLNKKSFKVEKSAGLLFYNTGGEMTHEAKNILKELPEDLKAERSHTTLMMDLNNACDYFGINFRNKRSKVKVIS